MYINQYQPSHSLTSINLSGDELIHFKTHQYDLHVDQSVPAI